MTFDFAPPCDLLKGTMSDLAMNCESKESCREVMLLPSSAKHLISCPLTSGELVQRNGTLSLLGHTRTMSAASVPLARNWLEQVHNDEGTPMFTEELSALAATPCSKGAKENCLVLGTSGRRLVRMAMQGTRPTSPPIWVPRQVLLEGHFEAPSSGSLALLQNRYMAVLHRKARAVHLYDMDNDGEPFRSWKLPPGDKANHRWVSLCAGGGSLFAMEDGNKPSIWRFTFPELS